MPRNVLVIGHSHVHAVRTAAIKRREEDPERPRTRTIYLLDDAFGGEMEGDDFSVGVKAAILDQVQRHNPIIASAIGGNAHAAMTMIPYRRIDFALSGDDALPMDEAAEILTEEEMRRDLELALRHDIDRLRLLHRLIGPYLHLESPPPVRRSDWVMEKAERFFTDKPEFHALGVAEPGIRYRAWRLANRIIKAELDALGCGYVSVPRHVCGDAGLLRPSFGRDATHGNYHFGEAMIQALEAVAS